MRSPPFGNAFRLTAMQCARIHFGTREGWARCSREAANGYHDILLMPLDEDPCSYAWPVTGRDVLIFFKTGIPQHLLDSLCRALLEQGARNVMGLGPTKDSCFLIGELANKEVAA